MNYPSGKASRSLWTCGEGNQCKEVGAKRAFAAHILFTPHNWRDKHGERKLTYPFLFPFIFAGSYEQSQRITFEWLWQDRYWIENFLLSVEQFLPFDFITLAALRWWVWIFWSWRLQYIQALTWDQTNASFSAWTNHSHQLILIRKKIWFSNLSICKVSPEWVSHCFNWCKIGWYLSSSAGTQ